MSASERSSSQNQFQPNFREHSEQETTLRQRKEYENEAPVEAWGIYYFVVIASCHFGHLAVLWQNEYQLLFLKTDVSFSSLNANLGSVFPECETRSYKRFVHGERLTQRLVTSKSAASKQRSRQRDSEANYPF